MSTILNYESVEKAVCKQTACKCVGTAADRKREMVLLCQNTCSLELFWF